QWRQITPIRKTKKPSNPPGPSTTIVNKDKEFAQGRKESAKMVLDSILNNQNVGPTEKLYQHNLRKWKRHITSDLGYYGPVGYKPNQEGATSTISNQLPEARKEQEEEHEEEDEEEEEQEAVQAEVQQEEEEGQEVSELTASSAAVPPWKPLTLPDNVNPIEWHINAALEYDKDTR
ncbi:hypothetical protein FBU30_008476, partial [Linnemannia zychae]